MSRSAFARPVRAVVLALALGFALPWLVWSTTIAEQRGLTSWHLPQSLAFWIGLPVAWLVATAISGGRAALADLVGRMLRWRVGWRAWVAAIGLAIALPGVVWVAVRLLGGGAPPADVTGLPAALLVETALFWLTEEPLWRGVLQPRFEHWLAPGPAALVVGVAWGLWHLPLFAIAGTFQSGLPIAGFLLLTVATAVILAWLFHLSGGSVLVCAVFHGVIDVVFATTGVLGASAAAFWAVVGVHVVVAGVLWWRGCLPPGRRRDGVTP